MEFVRSKLTVVQNTGVGMFGGGFRHFGKMVAKVVDEK